MIEWNRVLSRALGTLLLVPVSCLGTAPARAVAPAALTLDRVVRVDVDGDHRKDKVAFYIDEYSYVVKVTTAKKRRSSVKLAPGELMHGFYKAASLDGVKGKEIIAITDEEAVKTYEVLTWRHGRLVKAKAPMLHDRDGKRVGWTPAIGDFSGYRFFSSKGKRYVDATYLWFYEEEESWQGHTYRSVWKSGAWRLKHTSYRSELTEAQASALAGFHGI